MLWSLGLFLLVLIYFLFAPKKSSSTSSTKAVATPAKWKTILAKKVVFYQQLDEKQQLRFESDIKGFFADVTISGIQTEVNLEDRLLVASSAVIPLFGFPTWSYQYLNEVLLYPSSFDRDFNIGSKTEIITGMVGTGAMEGKMILSKPSLHAGFDIGNDKRNVGIHEFVHLFDKEDGVIDGIPAGYEERSYSLPWIDFIEKKTKEIVANRSDIHGYASTNRQEFFAVAAEYFFERPQLLKKKHPKLYEHLAATFNQGMAEQKETSMAELLAEPSRNSLCPCGSGQKFKRCCIS